MGILALDSEERAIALLDAYAAEEQDAEGANGR
jgi:hypothetical protein